MFCKVFLIRVQPTNVQSLPKDYRSFGVVWMSRQVTETFIAISRFYIQICNNLTVVNTNSKVKKYNAFFARLYVNLMSVWNSVETTQKKFEVLAHHVSRSKTIS